MSRSVLFVPFVVGCATSAPVPSAVAPAPAPIAAAPAPVARANVDAITPERAVRRLFEYPKVDAAWFTSDFLAAVPQSRVDEILASMRMDLGALREVSARGGSDFESSFERGTVPTYVKLDERGRFVHLFFKPAKLAPISVADALARFRALRGKVSVLVTDAHEGTNESIDADVPLAVGSSFKLAVLAALRTRVEKDKAMSMRQVVDLDAAHKSLPSGVLHTWPEKTPLTVGTLATLMISQSDNTATDMLVDLVGRSRVEALTKRNAPLLKTREAFTLKAKGNETLLSQYRAADEAGRRKVLERIRSMDLPPGAAIPDDIVTSDVEWFFTVRELCDLAMLVEDLPAMQVSSGLARKEDWDRVAYKGGSEPGVLNMTTVVRRGNTHACVSATQNDDHVLDRRAFDSAYRAVLSSLR